MPHILSLFLRTPFLSLSFPFVVVVAQRMSIGVRRENHSRKMGARSKFFSRNFISIQKENTIDFRVVLE